MALNQRPEWRMAKNGMWLHLPWHENNRDFLDDMKDQVPRSDRKWDNDKKEWWISDAYLDEVDNLIFNHFEETAFGRDE